MIDKEKIQDVLKNKRESLSKEEQENLDLYHRNMMKCSLDLAKELEDAIKKCIIDAEGFLPTKKNIRRNGRHEISKYLDGEIDFYWKNKLVLRAYKMKVERTQNDDGTMTFKITRKIERFPTCS